MTEEIEVPTEQLHETLHEHAHGHGGEGPPAWVSQVALSAALLAVMAAISALLAGHHANEAMLEQMKATDQWSYYQAKGIKANVLQTKIDLLIAMKQEPKADDAQKLEEYKKEQKEIEEKAHHEEHSSEGHMLRHSVLARTVTAVQIAIALSAIAVLSRKKLLWFVSLGLGVVGAGFMIQALI